VRPDRRATAAPRASQARYAVLVALVLFAVLAATPEILGALHLRNSSLPKTVNGVRLLPAPSAPPKVTLPSVATPIDPDQAPAPLPKVSATQQAATVAAEDSRIRLLVHDAAAVFQPEVIPVQGSQPTLVLTAGSGAYTYHSLVQYGALVLLPHHAGLLLDNVFVATNARLNLGGPNLRALYMESSASGFTSIVGWGGDLYFDGTAQHPMTIMGWDRTTNTPAPDASGGRSYIRDVGGKMVLADTRVSALGFWSGRTGGVAWTGSTSKPSTGGATDSIFTDETYGAFVTRGRNVTFHDDLFEFNELDGLHIHRNNTGTSVTDSSAARNGGNGFLVDPATSDTVLTADVSEHNAGDGFLIDGEPLATGASASGGSVTADTGTYLQHSAAIGNLQSGVVLEGGSGTVVRGDEICARLAGIAIREGAINSVVTGNDVRCNPRTALEIGPAAPQTVISGNTLVDARIGMLIRSSGPVTADSNRIIGVTVFGITARGSSSRVSGQDNVISGTGFRAVDARADAAYPALSGTQEAGWLHEVKLTVWSYLIFHPLALLWLSILVLVIFGEFWSRIRRMPPHPYPASTHWRSTASPPAAAAAATALLAGFGERVNGPAVRAPRPAEPVPRPAEPVPRPAEPVPRPVEPAPRSAEPVPRIARRIGDEPEPVMMAGETEPPRAPVSFVDLPVQPAAARRSGAHRSPAAPRSGGERPPESSTPVDDGERRDLLSPPPRRRTADPRPPRSAAPPEPSNRGGWFTPLDDPEPPRPDKTPRQDQPARLDRPFRLDRPPRPDSDEDARYLADWPMPPAKPKPPDDDLGESMDTRPLPVVEG
jgi:Right handed beta helix region